MDRRTAIAASSTGTLFLASTAVALLAVTGPAPHGGAGALRLEGASGAPTTVYDVRYVDDLPAAPTASDLGGPSSAVVGPGVAPGPVADSDAGAPAQAAVVEEEAAAAPAAPVAAGGAASGSTAPAAPGEAAAPVAAVPAGTPTGAPTRPAVPATTVAPAVPTTTAPPVPTTTLPPGTEISSSWPDGVPLPPIPPDCRKPHLEDDGRWNCEH